MRNALSTLARTGLPIAAMLTCASAQAKAPQMILFNGTIITVDPAFSTAEAVAISDGRFAAVGSNADVLKTADSQTQRIDLHGRTVLPGFNDSHVHMGAGRNYEIEVNLTDIHSIADIQKAIAARIAQVKPGEWISGSRGWWEYDLKDGRLPTRADLDAVSPANPVSIAGPHYQIANSLALKLAGITKETPNPQGGEIYKDKDGQPTGLLMDNASRAVSRFFPKPTPDQMMAGMEKLMQVANSNGLTSVGDPGGPITSAQLYRKLYDAGKLTLRIDFSYDIDPALPLSEVEGRLKDIGAPGQHWGDGMFRSDEIGETGLDGAELSAFLRDGFPGNPSYHGIQKVPNAQFDQFARTVNRYGWRLRPHAVGDGAIDEALEAFETANADKSIIGRRWMVDHAFLLGPSHYARVKALGLIINSQYMHNAQLGKLILAAWKQPLADRSEPYADWIKNGIMFANGSDGPVSYHAWPLYEIYGVVTRGTLWGGRLGPDQGISRQDAIRSVTINGAYTSFEEKMKGSIEPGKYADFVLLSANPMTIPAERIKDIKVIATVLGGKTVFGSLH